MRRRIGMVNIENLHIIDINKLSGEFYFTSLLQEAYTKGLLNDDNMEDIQLQCIKLLAYKSERYNDGISSSIRVEAAQEIMKSNLYTIGLYLKSLTSADLAVMELKRAAISEMYEKGRKLINAKFHTASHIYRMVQNNKLDTINYTYNATIDDEGIGIFFKSYDPEFQAHIGDGNIDYQLCHPVNDLAGVEYILKYLNNVYLENEFCKNFATKDIHHMLCGYDRGYKDLLINIFEQVLTTTLGCVLANRDPAGLDISKEEIGHLQNELSGGNEDTIDLKIHRAAQKVFKELNVTSPYLQGYVEKSLHKITLDIIQAVKTKTLEKTIVAPVNLDLKPKLQFISGARMDDRECRKFIDELLTCRYSSDKLVFIKEKARSFGDIEDVLIDGQLTQEEVNSVLGTLGDVEIGELIRRHPFKAFIQEVDLSEEEKILHLYLKKYIEKLPANRQKQIMDIANHLE
jgi:hypothetical protein